jgi:hypothetical protein
MIVRVPFAEIAIELSALLAIAEFPAVFQILVASFRP